MISKRSVKHPCVCGHILYLWRNGLHRTGIQNQGRTYALPIHIGNGCWLGGGVIVLPGVTIGDGSVIGAGSVVTKDIPGNVLAVGNPCRVIRKLNQES